jgi:predicted MFS family arabinose efflux permease
VRPVETVHSEVSALVGRVTTRVGGPARLRVVLLLAGVLSLQSADIGTIGALAEELEKALRVDNTELGLLTTAASLVGAVAALPVGVLADRSNRVRLLVWATAAWSVGMAASGFADGT